MRCEIVCPTISVDRAAPEDVCYEFHDCLPHI